MHEKFWEVLVETADCVRDDLFFALHLILEKILGICGRDDLFLLFTRFWAKNWASADAITFKEPVLFLRIENMVTPDVTTPFVSEFSNQQ